MAAFATLAANPKPQVRKKQRYSCITKVIDFDAHIPVQAAPYYTTAWRKDDVYQMVNIPAKTTVLNVQLEVLRTSQDSGDVVDVGYGDDVDRWGRYSLYASSVDDTISGAVETVHCENTNLRQVTEPNMKPLYFKTADTIDLVIKKAALNGKIRLIVHILEDDR